MKSTTIDEMPIALLFTKEAVDLVTAGRHVSLMSETRGNAPEKYIGSYGLYRNNTLSNFITPKWSDNVITMAGFNYIVVHECDTHTIAVSDSEFVEVSDNGSSIIDMVSNTSYQILRNDNESLSQPPWSICLGRDTCVGYL